MNSDDCGSIYGEEIYSAGIYSWETCWDWDRTVCGAEETLVRREVYAASPVANWTAVTCASLSERGV